MRTQQDKLDDARHPLLGSEHATVEANRCINCYDAPCINACPTQINIPQFIARIGSGDTLGAAQSILASNILGHSCATVCPVEVLCEGSCVYNKLEDPPIRIGDLQKYATEYFYTHNRKENLSTLAIAPKQAVRVAAIGGGPASLSFAAYIVLNGGQATVYEAAPQAGGLNTYGVAPYKLTYDQSLDEIAMIKELGVRIQTNTRIGENVTPQELLAKYDAVFLGTGLAEDRYPIPVNGTAGVTGALPFIAQIKQRGEEATQGITNALVIGGGNTALDVVQELALCKVPQIAMAYRRGLADMSGYAHEFKYARSYGVRFYEHHTPVRINQDKGQAQGVVFNTPNGETTLAADLVVFATGQERHPLQQLFPDLALNAQNCVVVDEKQQTNLAKVYAGGDCANGGKEVVNAVAEGRQAAFNVLQSMNLDIYYGRFSN